MESKSAPSAPNPLSSDDSSSSKEFANDKSDDSDDWITVLNRKPGALTHMRRRKDTRCKWEDHCAGGSQCSYRHTDYERKLFEKFPNVRFKFWKTRECNVRESHVTKTQREFCRFAHDKDDSWCLACKMYGHLTSGCKVKKTTA